MWPLSRIRQWLQRPPPLQVWFDEAFRVPLPSLEAAAGMDARRVDFVAWFLLDRRVIRPFQLRTPAMISFEDLLRVHTPDYLESLQQPRTLARIFGVDPSEIHVEALLRFIRMAAGATMEATRSVLARGGVALNLSGGFHHAAPSHGGGFCAVNDIAVAIAALRSEGFTGQISVLDLDAHPPDGTAECLRDDANAWIGSVSASRWGDLPGVDEVIVPDLCSDRDYHAALERLLERMPKSELAFVIAGGDVLAGDRFGRLALTLEGARTRDIMVSRAIDGVPSVWMPGGGYHTGSWKVLAGTALVLAGRPRRRIPPGYDPLQERFARVSRQLSPSALQGDLEITAEDIEGELAGRPDTTPRLLGYYTASGIEYALHRQGILDHVRRLGYDDLRVDISQGPEGDRLRLCGTAQGTQHVLIECEVARRRLGALEVLFVNWLTLRNPRASFSEKRPQLPGQEVPGLGLSAEAIALLTLMARRLALPAVVFRPAYYHLAYLGRGRLTFLDPERQGRFEALVRDLGHLPLRELSRALAAGKVRMNGEPYTWEASDMALWVTPPPYDEAWKKRVEAERERVRFEFP